MSKKLLIAAALVAGSASVAFAAEDMKTEAAEKGAEAKKMKKVAKPSKKAPAHMKHAQMPAHHKVAEAKGLTVTLGGDLTAQVGYRKEKNTYNTTQPGDTTPTAAVNKTHRNAIVNDTHVSVKADGHAHGMKYGGKVVLNADSSNSKYGYTLNTTNNNIAHETKAYVTTMFGKLEAGSTTGAYANMKVSSANFAHATGGIDGDAQYWYNPYMLNDQSNNLLMWAPEQFVVNPNLPSNYVHGLDAHSAKISYYTPSYMGFKVGVSYSPDSEQRGTVSKTSSVYRNVAAANSLTGYKNVWEGGLRYKAKFDGVGFQASVLGNMGTAKNFARAAADTQLQRHDLKAWEAGAALSYMGFTVAGSYADMGKSGTVKTYNGTNALTGKKKSTFWNAGAAYEYSNLGASLTYMESTHGAAPVRSAATTTLGQIASANSVVTLDSSNKYTAMSFGVDYKLAPGFMPYAEVTRFELKQGKPSQNTTLNATSAFRTRYKNSGYVVLAGTKLQF